MATVNKVFDIPRAKGKGDFKLVHATFSDWGAADGKYATGGVEVEMPDVKEVVVPVYHVCQSGGYLLNPVSYSGKAIKLMAMVTSQSGVALQELANDTNTSGVLKIDVAAICEAE